MGVSAAAVAAAAAEAADCTSSSSSSSLWAGSSATATDNKQHDVIRSQDYTQEKKILYTPDSSAVAVSRIRRIFYCRQKSAEK